MLLVPTTSGSPGHAKKFKSDGIKEQKPNAIIVAIAEVPMHMRYLITQLTVEALNSAQIALLGWQ